MTGLLLALAAPAAAQTPATIQTVPPVPGMRFALNGVEFRADATGRAHLPPGARGSPTALTTAIRRGVRARFDRWYARGRIAAIELEHRVGFRFVDLNGEHVDPRTVSSLALAGSNGRRYVLRAPKSRWLAGNRVIPESGGTRSTAVSYAADRAPRRRVVGGPSGPAALLPGREPQVAAAPAAVLRSLRGSRRPARLPDRLRGPARVPRREGGAPGARADGELTLKSLPRGDYRVRVDALGISSSRPISLSGDQDVRLQVISWLDIVIVLLALASIALALLFIRRPSGAPPPSRPCWCCSLAAPSAAAAGRPDRLFAYYYIWFNAGSWNRAKIDYPLLGRYSSDDRGVMERHVSWARQAGIDGFIVSWKSTPVLNRRLAAADRGGRRAGLQAARDLPGPRLPPPATTDRPDRGGPGLLRTGGSRRTGLSMRSASRS